MDTRRNLLKKKQRVVIKIGSSSLQHTETGDMDYIRLEVLVRELCNLKNQGKDVVLVSSGAIAQGKKPVRSQQEGRLWAARNALRPFQKNRLTRRLVRHA